jgi:NADH-quinone oxidoreductase subunit G
MMGLPGFDYSSSQEVLQSIPGLKFGETVQVADGLLNNRTVTAINLTGRADEPVVASIYQLDGIVRRSLVLQLTADANATDTLGVTA